jgi:type IV fimbrial biogenesis protein FimT
MGRQLGRQRLHTATEALAGDLAEARFEAARRGVPLHLEPQAGAGWCWAVASAPGCTCGGGPTCLLKRVQESDHGSVRLLAAQAVRFDPEGRADRSVAALFEAGGEQLRVDLSSLGRARVCDPDGRSGRVPRC